MAEKIMWLSRHDMSPAQFAAMQELHGSDVVVNKVEYVFKSADDLQLAVQTAMLTGFARVYAVAPAHMIVYLCALCAEETLRFGMFENDSAKRADEQFGLSKVYWLDVEPQDSPDAANIQPNNLNIRLVLKNHAPEVDKGDKLVPVIRR